MYPREYFIEQFQHEETDDLLYRYATSDLTDTAKEAIQALKV